MKIPALAEIKERLRLPISRKRLAEELSKKDREHRRTMAVRAKDADEKLDEERRRIDEIVKELSSIEFDISEHDSYTVTIGFDARLFDHGHMGVDGQRFIAQHIGRQVEHEIATSRFIGSAHQKRRKRETHSFGGLRRC